MLVATEECRNWSLLASRGEIKLRYNYAYIVHLCWINQR